MLSHSVEVAHVAAIMAAELGASQKTARRAALLHDVGKALTHEVEGSHAIIGAQLARKNRESAAVVHAIEAHHFEVEPQTIEAVLVQAADAISAARPGARGETMEHYAKRLEDLERIATSKPGVERCFAMQAGRRRARDGEARHDRRRRGHRALARDRARDRGQPRVPRSDPRDRDPRAARDGRRALSHDPCRRMTWPAWARPASTSSSTGLEALPVHGELAHAARSEIAPGGACNVAIACSRLGLRSALVAPVCQDDLGSMLTARLAGAGVDWVGPPGMRTPRQRRAREHAASAPSCSRAIRARCSPPTSRCWRRAP